MRILFVVALVLLTIIGPTLVLVAAALRRRSEAHRRGFTLTPFRDDQFDPPFTRPGAPKGNGGGGDPGLR